MKGQLRLKTIFREGKTLTEDLFFSSPFKMYSPFYDKKGRAKYINMCSSAGVLKGDENRILLDIGKNCNVIFTDQSYTKLFNTEDGFSSQNVKIKVEKNAHLIYSPHPIMTFAGCSHFSENTVEISKDSTLVFSEIYCCGRKAMGEEFALKKFRSRTEISIDGTADFIDNTLIEPEYFPVKQKGFFEGFTHMGYVYIYSPDRNDLLSLKNKIREENSLACTFTDKGLCVRMLSSSAEEITEKFKKFYI